MSGDPRALLGAGSPIPVCPAAVGSRGHRDAPCLLFASQHEGCVALPRHLLTWEEKRDTCASCRPGHTAVESLSGVQGPGQNCRPFRTLPGTEQRRGQGGGLWHVQRQSGGGGRETLCPRRTWSPFLLSLLLGNQKQTGTRCKVGNRNSSCIFSCLATCKRGPWGNSTAFVKNTFRERVWGAEAPPLRRGCTLFSSCIFSVETDLSGMPVSRAGVCVCVRSLLLCCWFYLHPLLSFGGGDAC